MSEPFIGEIRWFPYVRGAPTGWQLCDGSLMSISEYGTLYTLIGTTYGGDGANTFAVPDLRGAAPVHQGAGQGLTPRVLGQAAGMEGVTLTPAQLAPHSHLMMASTSAATSMTPLTSVPAATSEGLAFYADAPTVAPANMGSGMILPSGGNQPHDNCMPTLALSPCMATAGIFPSQP